MAEFCKQCSIIVWGEDTGDFKGIQEEKHTKEGVFTHVICEHCGPTIVDHLGVCVYKDCIEKHGQKNPVV